MRDGRYWTRTSDPLLVRERQGADERASEDTLRHESPAASPERQLALWSEEEPRAWSDVRVFYLGG